MQICADCDMDLTTVFESNQPIQSVLDSVQNIPNWNLVYNSIVNQSTKNLQTELAPSIVKASFVWIHQYKNHTRYKHFIHPYCHSSDSKCYCRMAIFSMLLFFFLNYGRNQKCLFRLHMVRGSFCTVSDDCHFRLLVCQQV